MKIDADHHQSIYDLRNWGSEHASRTGSPVVRSCGPGISPKLQSLGIFQARAASKHTFANTELATPNSVSICVAFFRSPL